VLPLKVVVSLYSVFMQEPVASDASDAPQEHKEHECADRHPRSIDELGKELEVDGELRSLVDGVAMLGRFEAQLAEFESTLGQAVARGS
jgi:hypothetical protein